MSWLEAVAGLEIDVWDGEDSDTSASSSDEEEGQRLGRARSSSKTSRWSKMKAKAANIRGSSPKSSGLPPREPTPDPASDPSRLAPSSSPQQFRAEPRVLHGYTLTQSIPFRAVCHAIRNSAFVASDLPLIVSLEVHANLDQQQTMVQIMKESWQGNLVDNTSILGQEIETLPLPWFSQEQNPD